MVQTILPVTFTSSSESGTWNASSSDCPRFGSNNVSMRAPRAERFSIETRCSPNVASSEGITKKRSDERSSSMRLERFDVCSCEMSERITSGEP